MAKQTRPGARARAKGTLRGPRQPGGSTSWTSRGAPTPLLHSATAPLHTPPAMLVPLRLRHKRPQNLQVLAGQLRVPSSRPPRRPRRLRLVSVSVKLARPALDNFVRFALRRLCRTSLLAHTQLIQRHNRALERTHLTCFLAVLLPRLGACCQPSLRGEAPGQ